MGDVMKSLCVCSICGDRVGLGVDHSDCSKIKKEIYGDSCENKRPVKKLSKNSIDYLTNLLSRDD